jgi:hypothetical protein
LERRARKRRCIAGRYLEGMPIPAPSLPNRAGAQSLSTGTSMAPATHGRGAALQAPTPIREDRTQQGKCCVSSSSIRSHGRQVGVSPFMAALFGPCTMSDLSQYAPQSGSWRDSKDRRPPLLRTLSLIRGARDQTSRPVIRITGMGASMALRCSHVSTTFAHTEFFSV